ncbi:MAG: porin family protein [Bacteroidetes bacterium]|nr:porin family protein [Bacteroidota bacterium]MDA1267922.1 porin family protein [Bacteroidota bacterium]
MKKGVLILAFLIFTAAAQAQIGVRAGIGSTNFSNGESQRAFTSITGIHLGAYYGLRATNKLTVEPGLFYSGKGYKTVPLGASQEIKENLGYLDIPLLARYAFNSTFNLFAGPQAGFLLSRTRTSGTVKDTNAESLGGYEIGAILGMGYQMSSGVNLQFSYDFGVVPFKYYEFEVNNTVFKLSVGYTLPSKAAKEKTE